MIKAKYILNIALISLAIFPLGCKDKKPTTKAKNKEICQEASLALTEVSTNSFGLSSLSAKKEAIKIREQTKDKPLEMTIDIDYLKLTTSKKLFPDAVMPLWKICKTTDNEALCAKKIWYPDYSLQFNLYPLKAGDYKLYLKLGIAKIDQNRLLENAKNMTEEIHCDIFNTCLSSDKVITKKITIATKLENEKEATHLDLFLKRNEFLRTCYDYQKASQAYANVSRNFMARKYAINIGKQSAAYTCSLISSFGKELERAGKTLSGISRQGMQLAEGDNKESELDCSGNLSSIMDQGTSNNLTFNDPHALNPNSGIRGIQGKIVDNSKSTENIGATSYASATSNDDVLKELESFKKATADQVAGKKSSEEKENSTAWLLGVGIPGLILSVGTGSYLFAKKKGRFLDRNTFSQGAQDHINQKYQNASITSEVSHRLEGFNSARDEFKKSPSFENYQKFFEAGNKLKSMPGEIAQLLEIQAPDPNDKSKFATEFDNFNKALNKNEGFKKLEKDFKIFQYKKALDVAYMQQKPSEFNRILAESKTMNLNLEGEYNKLLDNSNDLKFKEDDVTIDGRRYQHQTDGNNKILSSGSELQIDDIQNQKLVREPLEIGKIKSSEDFLFRTHDIDFFESKYKSSDLGIKGKPMASSTKGAVFSALGTMIFGAATVAGAITASSSLSESNTLQNPAIIYEPKLKRDFDSIKKILEQSK